MRYHLVEVWSGVHSFWTMSGVLGMISRKTALLIGEGYKLQFSYLQFYRGNKYYKSKTDELYLFLFEREYDAWFCNLARKHTSTQSLMGEFIARLHTGESISSATTKWSEESRRKRSQQLLIKMAVDYLNAWNTTWLLEKSNYGGEDQKLHYPKLISSLEIDGYLYRDSKLLFSERDVFDVQEEQGIIHQLYVEMKLRQGDTAFHHLRLSEEHYVASKWDDSISNSRKFLECVLMQVAAEHSRTILQTELSERTLEKPVEVREYLEKRELLDAKEKEAFAKVYGLLSHTGSHPNMAEKDERGSCDKCPLPSLSSSCLGFRVI